MDQTGASLDTKTYSYPTDSDQLTAVTGAIPSGFSYDPVGRLQSDTKDTITQIYYLPGGKPWRIVKERKFTPLPDPESTYTLVTDYWYDPLGNKTMEYTHSRGLEQDIATQQAHVIRGYRASFQKYGLGLTLFANGLDGRTLAIYEGEGESDDNPRYTIEDAYLETYIGYGLSGRFMTALPKNGYPYNVSLADGKDLDSLGMTAPDGSTLWREYRRPGVRRFEVKDHLGNIRSVVSDARYNPTVRSYFQPEQISLSNYYPYGKQLDDYSWASDLHRYGFHGMEMENRIASDSFAITGGTQAGIIHGEGKHYGTYFRMYDSDIGRWWGTDPITHPFQTPYNAFDNNPALFTDVWGADSDNYMDDPLNPDPNRGGGGYDYPQAPPHNREAVITAPRVPNNPNRSDISGSQVYFAQENHLTSTGYEWESHYNGQAYVWHHGEIWDHSSYLHLINRQYDGLMYHEGFDGKDLGLGIDTEKGKYYWKYLSAMRPHPAKLYLNYYDSDGNFVYRKQNPYFGGHGLEPFDDIWLIGGTAAGLGRGAINRIGRRAAKTLTVPRGTNIVYHGLDDAGKVRYIGITNRPASIRFAEHLNSGTAKSLLDYEIIEGAVSLSRIEARIWEQQLINSYGLQKNGGLLLNKINSISPKYWPKYGIK